MEQTAFRRPARPHGHRCRGPPRGSGVRRGGWGAGSVRDARRVPGERRGVGQGAGALRPAPAPPGHLHLRRGRRPGHRPRRVRTRHGPDHRPRPARRGGRPLVPGGASRRPDRVRRRRARGRGGDRRPAVGPQGAGQPEHRRGGSLPPLRAPGRTLAVQRQLRLGKRRRAPGRRLGRTGRTHPPGHALRSPAGPGTAGSARPPGRHRPGRCPRPRRGPRHGHGVHLPPGRGRGDPRGGRPGADPAGCRAPAPHLPPGRTARLSRQRTRQHRRGLRVRPGDRTPDRRRATVHRGRTGPGGGHQLPGAVPGHGRRRVRLPRQPGARQPDAVRGGGSGRPAPAPRHGAGGRRLPAADRLLTRTARCCSRPTSAPAR
ncbi:hypothetical protein RKD37_000969 [Streptomyces ambofaciens]